MTWIHTEHLWQWNNSFSAEVLEAAMPALVSWDSSISQRTIVLFVFYITDVNNLMMWIGESVSLWHGPMPARFPVAGSLLSRSKEIRVDFQKYLYKDFWTLSLLMNAESLLHLGKLGLQIQYTIKMYQMQDIHGVRQQGTRMTGIWPICTNQFLFPSNRLESLCEWIMLLLKA